jgi:hypothetical protein
VNQHQQACSPLDALDYCQHLLPLRDQLNLQTKAQAAIPWFASEVLHILDHYISVENQLSQPH